MATKQKTQARKSAKKAQQPTGPLVPQVVRNETAAMDAALASGRKRPFVAINDEGKLVVCSRRTAAKYGWEGQGALYSRHPGDGTTGRNGTAKQKSGTDAAWERATKQKQEPASARNIARTVRRAVRAEFAAITGRK